MGKLYEKLLVCSIPAMMIFCVVGCGTRYVTPGGGAALASLTDVDISLLDKDIQKTLDRKPVIERNYYKLLSNCFSFGITMVLDDVFFQDTKLTEG